MPHRDEWRGLNMECRAEREACDSVTVVRRRTPICSANSPEGRWICTRYRGHSGDHVAAAGNAFLDRWNDHGRAYYDDD